MRRRVLLALSCLLSISSAHAHVFADETVVAGDSLFGMERLHDPNIALMVIHTEGAEEPYYERIDAPEGLWGVSITNETKVPGRVCCSLDGITYYDSGDFAEDLAGMTVKVRGNTSSLYAKKPYKIKLQTKADLLSRGNDELYAHKDWLLIYTPDVSMKMLMGFWVNELMGMQWTPACRFVNVVMNGKYRGLYLLTEAVERGAGRLRVNKNTGYILECDAYWWKEEIYAESSISEYVNYTFKHPAPDDITAASLQYISDEVAKLEASVQDGTYPQYMDVESFASWLLAHDLLGTWDSGGSNIFLTKFDNTPQSKFMMANLWDFDSIERDPAAWARIHYDPNPFFFPRLFNSPDRTFTRTYVEKWMTDGNSVTDLLLARIDSLAATPLMTSLEHFRVIDRKVMPGDNTPLAECLQKHKDWFENRRTWLNAKVDKLGETVSIRPAKSVIVNDNSVYDLSGRRVNSTYKGIVIRGGKRYFSPSGLW